MSAVAPEGERFGPFTLLRPIGEGGMGQLDLAALDQPGVPRLCVVKRMVPRLLDPNFRERFSHEGHVWRELAHENVVRLLDAGDVEGRPYLAMEFVDGRDLAQVWRQCTVTRQYLPLAIAVHVVDRLLAALAYLHNRRDLSLVHRDIAPANVMLSFDGAVKLTDFGLARSALSTTHTATGATFGRASYQSPEQAAGQPLDARSDIYAAGIVLWELLARRPLFPIQEIGDWDRTNIAPPSSHDRTVTKGLDDVALRALAPSPEDRFQSAGDFRAALRESFAKMATAPEVGAFMLQLFGAEARAPELIATDGVPSRSPSSPAPSAPSRKRVRVVLAVGVFAMATAVAMVLRPRSREMKGPGAGAPDPAHHEPSTPAPAASTAPSSPSPVEPTLPPPSELVRTSPHADNVVREPGPLPPGPARGAAADEATRLAEEAYRSGRYIDAARLGKRAVELGGGVPARLVLGKALMDMELFDEAKVQFDRVLAKEPNNQVARAGHKAASGQTKQR